MKGSNLIMVILTAWLMTACGSGVGGIGSFDLGGFHVPVAVPGGPYDGMAGQPVQFDGSRSSDSEGHALTYSWDFGDGGSSTLAMPTHTYVAAGTYDVILKVCDSAGVCSFGVVGTTAVIASPASPSPGGVWLGEDSDGTQLVALVTETGRFQLLDENEFQGSGILTVAVNGEISASFEMLAPLGGSFPNGGIYADCSLSGFVVARATVDGSVVCTARGTGSAQTTVSVGLSYQALYDLGSDLATFAGTWTTASNPGSDVVNVDSMGVISGQDGSGSGCVYSGQVAIIDARFNAYDVEWTYASCTGPSAALDGATFSGIGTIDNTIMPAEFILGATGIARFNSVSLVLFYEST